MYLKLSSGKWPSRPQCVDILDNIEWIVHIVYTCIPFSYSRWTICGDILAAPLQGMGYTKKNSFCFPFLPGLPNAGYWAHHCPSQYMEAPSSVFVVHVRSLMGRMFHHGSCSDLRYDNDHNIRTHNKDCSPSPKPGECEVFMTDGWLIRCGECK